MNLQRTNQCPVELRSLLGTEIASNGLRYMLAMYWQGRADKILCRLLPLLEWVTQNGLPENVSSAWVGFESGHTAFSGEDHAALLTAAVKFAQASLSAAHA